MNEVLLDAFRHNSWATRQLLAACRGLAADQLTAAASASFGSILATFKHIIMSDASYLHSLGGSAPAWLIKREQSDDLDQLQARVEETERNWERLLAEPLDAERVIILDKGAYEAHAGVLIAQALHHGNAHREQISAMLTGLGVEPPGLQPWEYADATGRGRERHAGQ
jgi:uncharacterized damage-inducible protein DinB